MFDTSRLKNFPELPGVYQMKDAKGDVLYVGKAKDLKARIRQYFQGSDERAQIPYLLQHVHEIDCTITRSEKEALLLEQALIQRFKPHYNILLKDDKSQLKIVLTKHAFPRLELLRSKDAEKGLYQSTSFSSPRLARDMFDLTAKVFQLRQCSDPEFKRRTRPCILYHIKKCTAPCVGYISEKEYSERVSKAIRMLKGDVQSYLVEIKQEMGERSDKNEFEMALALRKRKEILETFIERCQVESVRGVRSCDVIGFWVSGHTFAFSTLRYREGKLQDSATSISESWSTTDEAITDFLLQFYRKTSVIGSPQEILLPFAFEGFEEVQDYIREELHISAQMKVPSVGSKKELIRIANENAKSALSTSVEEEGIRLQLLSQVQEKLKLWQIPKRIDCFDSSHLGGSDNVMACVSFLDGKPFKQGYRTLAVKNAAKGDDYGMLKEAIYRRYKDVEARDLPDLIVVDGGKGQLNAAMQGTLLTLASECDMVSIAKEEGRHDKGLTKELLFKAPHADEIRLNPTDPVLLFLQTVRDEAHRFVIQFQKKKRLKRTLHSQLDGIAGIGPARKKLLLKAFGSVEAIRKATVKEVIAKTKLPENVARGLLYALQGKTD